LDIDQRVFLAASPAWRRHSLFAHISQQVNVMGKSLSHNEETNDFRIRRVFLPVGLHGLAHPGENVIGKRWQAPLAESPYA
jgi:hypothetical protein